MAVEDHLSAAAQEDSVVVAVNVRPLIDLELAEGCKPCLHVTPGEPQVGHGAHLFRYDHVFGDAFGAEPAAALYGRCVAPLVDGLLKGYNATVLAYGQTGSGKTYTMGSAFSPGGADSQGVIPAVMEAVFCRMAEAPADIDFTVRVGFVEIHKEEIHDLLCTRGPRPAVHIREVAGGGVCLAGANEREVRSRQEMVDVLEQGTLLRATAATGMNKQSSRSHAIFTITLEQRRLLPPRAGDSLAGAAGGASCGDDSGESGDEDEEGDEEAGGGGDDCYLCAKMHLVDLAGSERAKRTKAVGQRLQEGININKGLLALGNVINALSEGKQHVPYRDSKLTRMLQDSLGGNSRTLMIACVSPADVNLEESLNTLRYANRARNIRNKPVVNRDPVAAQIAHMRQQLAALRAENQGLKCKLGLGEGAGALDFGGPGEEVLRAAMAELEARNRALQKENARLHVEVGTAHEDLKDVSEKMIVAQTQSYRLLQRLQQADPAAAAEAGAAADAIAGGTGSEGDVVRCQLERIAELERECKRLKQVSRLSGAFAMGGTRRQSLGTPGGDLAGSPFGQLSPFRGGSEDGGEGEDGLAELADLHDDELAAHEQAHTQQVARLQVEMARLQVEMEAKQAAMQSMSGHAVLKQKYDEKLVDLQAQRDELQRERYELQQKLEALQHASAEERERLKAQYETRIKQLDAKVKAVRAKERRVLELERLKGKAESACRKLETDILSMKQQKVTLHRQMEKGAREFAEWKRQRDRELLQLKKQGRLNAAQLQKLEALHSKQQAVLRRKTEEAEAARKRLKQLEDRQRLAIRPATAASSAAPPSERPFTAPAAALAPAPVPLPAPRAPQGHAVERSGSSASSAAAQAEAECQPNPVAPLLRDERGRREWVEGELDAYCSSYELQKVVEGERAQRSEVQCKLRDVEKTLAALKNPEWWGPAQLASPSGASEEALMQRKLALLQQSDLHSKQFEQAQAQLMEARQAEEARGGVPGDARRWNGVRTVVQARALLKTVFRSASQHKAQAYEAQAQVTELSEEMELLRLKLDIAEQEKCEAQQRVAEAEVLIAHQQAGGAAAADAGTTTPAKQLLPPQLALPAEAPLYSPVAHPPTDDGLREAREILQQLNVLATDDPGTAGATPEVAAAGAADAEEEREEEEEEEASGSEEESSWDEDEDEEDEEDEEEEEEQSEDEERHALWDPSTATPARGGARPRKQAVAGGGGEAQQRQRRRRSSTLSGGSGSGGSGALLPEEQPVLAHLNEQLKLQGKAPVGKPTIALMREVLKDKMIQGQRWRLGSKKREDVIRDYRAMLGLKPDVDSPTASGGSTGGGWVRLLEHTASSLARRNDKMRHHASASVQQPQQQAQAHLAAAVAPPAAAAAAAAAKAFGSPVPPPRSSKGGSVSCERPDASTTPVGAEGLTPEAAGLEARQVPPLTLSSASPGGGSGLQRGRDASSSIEQERQLHDLQQQLSQLTGQAPEAAASMSGSRGGGGAAAAAPAAAGQEGSFSPPPQGDTGASKGSPFKRPFSLAGWGRGASPQRATPPSNTSVFAVPAAAAPAAAGQPASPASKRQMDAGLQSAGSSGRQRSGSSSPSRLARFFGWGGEGSGGMAVAVAAKAGGGAGGNGGGGVSAATEATYDLVRPDRPAAAQPLRSSNSNSNSNSTASEAGMGAGSVRSSSGLDHSDPSHGMHQAAENQRGSRPPSGSLSPPQSSRQLKEDGGGGAPGPAGGRPRSGGGTAPLTARAPISPRKTAWKPL